MKGKDVKRIWALLLVACFILTTALPINAAQEFGSTYDGIQSEESTPPDEATPPETESSAEEEVTDEAISTEAEEGLVQDEAVAGARATAADYVEPIQGDTGNKKGIQGTAFWAKEGDAWDGQDQEFKDNVDQVFLNYDLKSLFEDIDYSKTSNQYVYNGRTYYFNYENFAKYYEYRIRELRAAGKVVTVELLLSWSDNAAVQNLIYSGGRQKGYYFYAWNANDPTASETLSAALDFTFNLLGQSDCFVQNWIVGNEADLPIRYNHTGTSDKNTNIAVYSSMYNLVYQARQNQSPYSKVYACVTNCWTYNPDGIPTRDFIDAFAAAETGKDWCLAFHAYAAKQNENMWNQASGPLTQNDRNAQYVTAANLNVLTDYIKNTYGTSHRIILSEQGFSSATSGGEAAQAASIAYLYYAAANNPMIDAMHIIWYTDIYEFGDDHNYMGLYTRDGERKEAYDVFKYMNKANGHQYTDPYLKVIIPNGQGIAIQNWSDNIIYHDQGTTPGGGLTPAASIKITQANLGIIGRTNVNVGASSSLQYRYEVNGGNAHIGYSTEGWALIKDWSSDPSFTYVPAYSGSYVIVCKIYNPDTGKTIQAATGVNFKKMLKGTCQMPDPYGRGYLIGIESFSNPNQSYRYEMQIYDIKKAAWTYTTGKCLTPGTSLWTTWKPKQGCYWTLFLIYDEHGNVIDKDCYSFIAY